MPDSNTEQKRVQRRFWIYPSTDEKLTQLAHAYSVDLMTARSVVIEEGVEILSKDPDRFIQAVRRFSERKAKP